MWITDTSREQFIEILQNGPKNHCNLVEDQTKNKSKCKRMQKSEIRLVWSDKPNRGERPQIIVVKDSEIDDFFAWTSTYLSSWSPISAYFRVLSEDEQIISHEKCQSALRKTIESASVGIIIGEAFTQSNKVGRVGEIRSSWCLATFSYVAAQAAKTDAKLDVLADKWLECRKLTNQLPLSVNVENLLFPWQALLNAVEHRKGKSGQVNESIKSIFVECLADVIDRGVISTEVWRKMTANCKAAAEAAELMNGNRETRVTVFENFVREVRSEIFKDSFEISFIAGYLASRISPGTFDQVRLLQNELKLFPSSILWLGIFASMNAKEQVSSSSVGRKIWKELGDRKYYFSRPRIDIGLRELRVLVRGGVFEEDYKTDIPGSLVVELEPWITTRVRWPTQDSRPSERTKSKYEDKNGNLNEIELILDELRVGLTEIGDKLKIMSTS